MENRDGGRDSKEVVNDMGVGLPLCFSSEPRAQGCGIANSVANRVQMMNLVRGAAIGWEQTAYERWWMRSRELLRTQG